MTGIHIGTTIIKKREEKGITQDTLATFIGVSKASVSKWETGKSYPDITLLPKLAAYFNVTIDALIGYSPQLSKEEIKRLYHKLAADLGVYDFNVVMDECRALIHKYYACPPFLLQMGVLIVNHYMLRNTKAGQEELIREAIQLFSRVKSESDDVWLNTQANSMEAVCHLILNEPQETLMLLEHTMQPSIGDEIVLSSAYQMIGKTKEAKQTLQVNMYQNLLKIIGSAPSYLLLNVDDPEKFDEILNRVELICSTFDIVNLHPNVIGQFYYGAAEGYAMQGDVEKALHWLEQFAFVCTAKIFPFTLHGDHFFDLIDPWLAKLDLGINAVRDEVTIKDGMIKSVTEQPAFAILHNHKLYKVIVENLKYKLGAC